MLLSEHVYCVAVTFKMIEQVERQICIKFCIQKATAMGNWWLAASSRQCTLMHQVSCRVFFVKHQITQVTQPPYSPYLVPCDYWLFSKLKSPLKGKRFQRIDEIQENTARQLMAIRRPVWGPKVPTLKGTEVLLSYVQCFLYLFQ